MKPLYVTKIYFLLHTSTHTHTHTHTLSLSLSVRNMGEELAEDGDEEGAVVAMAQTKIISQIVKKNVIENLIPIVIAAKHLVSQSVIPASMLVYVSLVYVSLVYVSLVYVSLVYVSLVYVSLVYVSLVYMYTYNVCITGVCITGVHVYIQCLSMLFLFQFEKIHSPLLKDLLLCLKEIMQDFRSEVTGASEEKIYQLSCLTNVTFVLCVSPEVLAADKQLAEEIEFDLKRVDEEEKRAARAARAMADRTPLPNTPLAQMVSQHNRGNVLK